MIHTPPLARRVVRLGVGVVAVTLLAVNLGVFAGLAKRLSDSVDDLLAERVVAVRAEAATVAQEGGGPEELARRLQARGLRTTVRAPDGTEYTAEPASPVVGSGLPGIRARDEDRTRLVSLPGGLEAEVAVSTTGVSEALRELLLIQGVISVGGLLLAALLLRRSANRAMRPVSEIAEAATRTAAGTMGERLSPDDAGTELGRMATAYDEMLDALETSLAQSREAGTARALLAAVVEGSTDTIWVQDLDGTILTWNTAAERTLGWTADEVVGSHVSLVVPTNELPELSALVAEVVAAGDIRAYEGERLTRAGKSLPVSVRLSPVRDEQGEIVAVAAGARDVTEQRWLAEALNSTLAALQEAAAEARASEEAARRFLADAAHQLRTPMAGIRACAETMLRGNASPEDSDRLMATMVRETSRAARLIASLLRMARLDQGLAPEKEQVDLLAVCGEEVERLSLLSPDLDVRLQVQGQPPGRVPADPAGCREILSNLGDNARRHATSSVCLRVEADDATVSVRVADDGPGVPVEARAGVRAVRQPGRARRLRPRAAHRAGHRPVDGRGAALRRRLRAVPATSGRDGLVGVRRLTRLRYRRRTGGMDMVRTARRSGNVEQDGVQHPRIVLRDKRSRAGLQSGDLEGLEG